MNESRPHLEDDAPAELLRRLEQRLERIEKHLGLSAPDDEVGHAAERTGSSPDAGVASPPLAPVVADGDDLEFELGQTWFAKLGVIVLALGVAFLLSLPFPQFPAAVPALAGYVLAGALFLLAHVGRRSFELVSRYLRGAGMALLCFATLRLIFFGHAHALDAASPVAWALLVIAVAINMAIALSRRSPYLTTLATTTGCAAALAMESRWAALGLTTALVLTIVLVCRRHTWPAVLLVAMPLIYATYAVIALNNPLLGREAGVVHEPLAGLGLLVAWSVAFAASSWWPDQQREDAFLQVGTLLNAGLGYGLFLLHSRLGFESLFFTANLLAAVVFLGLAIACWTHARNAFATFVYAMTGYMALSFAIIKISHAPDVFVWLSLQSLLVVTTAIWFRSRFIVVGNFAIYVLVVAAYVIMAPRENGISLGFGIVALLSARLLNWKKHRLELQTELMRNAYLVVAFAVFPYAVYHLVPEAYVVPAWAGIAVFYYVMNGMIRNRKYRWMGHLTLLLTAGYALLIGTNQLEPAHRVISFIVLGTILLVVSLVFTRLRTRAHAGSPPAGG